MAKGSGKIKTPAMKERVLSEVARLDRCGYSQAQIAVRLKECVGVGVTQPMICNYLKEIRLRYKTQALADRAEKVNEMLESLRDVRAEAWASYERSKLDSERLVRESVRPFEKPELKQNAKGSNGRRGESTEASLVLLKEIVTTEGRLPANVYLQTVLDTLKAERDLLGLDAPKEVDVTQRSTVLNLDDLIRDQLAVVDGNDPVEAEIAEVERLALPEPEGDAGAPETS